MILISTIAVALCVSGYKCDSPSEPVITTDEMKRALVIASRLGMDTSPFGVEKLSDGWIRLDSEGSAKEQDSQIELNIQPSHTSLRSGKLFTSETKPNSPEVSQMIANSFAHVFKEGYRSHGYSVWVRDLPDGWLVIWAKLPLRFHDQLTVRYSNDFKFESISR